MKQRIIKAQRAHLESHIKKHVLNVDLLLENPVGVAEHPDIMETIEKELGMIAEYHDKLEMLETYF